MWWMLGGALAWAGDDGAVSLTGALDTEARYRRSDAELPGFEDRAIFDVFEWVGRASAQATVTAGGFDHQAYVQVDTIGLLANRYYLDDVLHVETPLTDEALRSPWPGDFYANVEKASYVAHRGAVTVTLGDAYASFGRGIALDLDRNVEIDIDTSVRGLKVQARPGMWDVTAVAGYANRQQVQQDLPNRDIGPDLPHGVAALRVERFGLGPASVAAQVVAIDDVDAPGREGFSQWGTPDVVVAGGSVDAYGIGGVDVYAEGDAFLYPTDVAWGGGDAQTGYAAYLSAMTYRGRTIWLVEGKRYKDAEPMNGPTGPELYRMSGPPSLEYERVITEDSSAALASSDIFGGRLRVDLGARPGADPAAPRAVPYASVAVLRDLEVGGLHFNQTPETVVHPVVGVEALSGHSSLLLNVGARVDRRDGGSDGSDRQLHLDVDGKVPIAGEWGADLAVAVESFAWGNNALQQEDYLEVESALSMQRGANLTLIGYLDYSDNPLVNTVGNLSDDVYGAVEVAFKPTDAWTVKAFYGAYKAGIRCSGGQCRQLPGFDGGRVSVGGTF